MNPTWQLNDYVYVTGMGHGHITDYVQSTGRTEVKLEAGGTVVVNQLRLVRGDAAEPVDDELNARAEVLRTAESLVNGDRNAQYGDPRQDFQRTADLWTTYLDGKTEIEPHDVAIMMTLLKISRLRWSPEKLDSWVDGAGYLACGWDCARPE